MNVSQQVQVGLGKPSSLAVVSPLWATVDPQVLEANRFFMGWNFTASPPARPFGYTQVDRLRGGETMAS